MTAANDSNVFTFNNTFATSGPQQLEEINLLPLGTAASGLSITVSAVPTASGGDGFANVGFINAQYNLGTVTIHGDLGRIDAGNSVTPTTGLTALSVHSMGVFGTTTQAAGGNLGTNIYGKLGTLTVGSDIDEASVYVEGGAAGIIGRRQRGGSLIGGSPITTGEIESTGNMGPVTIGGDLVGGAGEDSGLIYSGGALGQVSVGGNIQGGSGLSECGVVYAAASLAGARSAARSSAAGGGSGAIEAGTTLGQVNVGGAVVGGSAEDSGVISSTTSLAGVSVGGALVGGSTIYSGAIECSTGPIGMVRSPATSRAAPANTPARSTAAPPWPASPSAARSIGPAPRNTARGS